MHRPRISDREPSQVLPPGRAGPVIEAENLGHRGLYTSLAGHELTITRAHETIRPTTLGPHDARDLARPQSSPALLSHRISFSKTGTPVVGDHALLAADSVVISVSRSVERHEVQYILGGAFQPGSASPGRSAGKGG